MDAMSGAKRGEVIMGLLASHPEHPFVKNFEGFEAGVYDSSLLEDDECATHIIDGGNELNGLSVRTQLVDKLVRLHVCVADLITDGKALKAKVWLSQLGHHWHGLLEPAEVCNEFVTVNPAVAIAVNIMKLLASCELLSRLGDVI